MTEGEEDMPPFQMSVRVMNNRYQKDASYQTNVESLKNAKASLDMHKKAIHGSGYKGLIIDQRLSQTADQQRRGRSTASQSCLVDSQGFMNATQRLHYKKVSGQKRKGNLSGTKLTKIKPENRTPQQPFGMPQELTLTDNKSQSCRRSFEKVMDMEKLNGSIRINLKHSPPQRLSSHQNQPDFQSLYQAAVIQNQELKQRIKFLQAELAKLFKPIEISETLPNDRAKSFYNDVYLTDLKTEISDITSGLRHEQQTNTQQLELIKQLQSEVNKLRGTVQFYRKQIVQLSKEKPKVDLCIEDDETKTRNTGKDLTERIEKLQRLMDSITNEPKMINVFQTLFENLQELTNCASVQVFMFNTNGITFTSDTLTQQKTIFEGRYMEALYLNDTEIVPPKFQKRYECQIPIRQPHYMSVPVHHDDQLHFVIQVLSKKNNNLHIGFTPIDFIIFSVISSFLNIKLRDILTSLESKKVRMKDLQTIKIAARVSTQRSYADLVLAVSESLPAFFECEGCALLFRDQKTNQLFVIDYDLNPGDQKFVEYVQHQKKMGIQLTAAERIKDFERQLQPGTKHIFPNSIGVIGQVFKTQKVVYSSSIKTLANFVPGLDNQCKFVQNVKSIVVAPVFGHKNADGSDNLVAIIELVNRNGGVFTAHDLNRLEMVSALIGQSVQNASEHHSVINVKVGVQKHLGDISDIMTTQKVVGDESSQSLMDVSVPMLASLNIVRAMEADSKRKNKMKKQLLQF